MYLLNHNAHLTLIQSPAVPRDDQKGIPPQGLTTRWTGDAQAYIDEDIADVVKGGQRFQISQTFVDLPVNMPVWPNQEDWITIRRIPGLSTYSPQAPLTETLLVRTTDGGLTLLGRLRLYVVRS